MGATPEAPVPAGELAAAAWDALRLIPDPELGIDIVSLGLVYGVDVDGGHVHVIYTLTTLGCGIGPILEGQMYEVLYAQPGVELVTAQLVLEPAWTRDRMAPDARAVVGDRPFHPPAAGAGIEQATDDWIRRIEARMDQAAGPDPGASDTR